MAFGDLVQDPGERHLIYGGTRTGKSSLMDWSIRHIQKTRPDAMILVLDTKPRFRAEFQPRGPARWSMRKSAESLYKGWSKGPVMPNSVAMDWESSHPFRGMWNYKKHPGEVVIMQSDDPVKWSLMLSLTKEFIAKRLTRERLVVVDEGMDFYQRNSLGIDPRNDVILRTARAGGERNIGLLFGAHRPYGIPPLLNTLTSRVTLFHLRYQHDMQYLQGMGIPEEDVSPSGKYIFKQYQIEPGGIVSDPVTSRLALPDSYLAQLSAT
jgi:hypothetical protein